MRIRTISRQCAYFCVVAILATSFSEVDEARAQERPRNVILLIADGYGPASATLARDFAGRPLTMDAILVGTMKTYATDSRVTDSAAAATAFASGIKTYNGAIGMDTLRHPVGTLLEAAVADGLATGLVSTASITHATPAAFSAHVERRSSQTEIAAQQTRQSIDVILGGGTQFFLPDADGGVREDDDNLLEYMRDQGYQVVRTRDELLDDVSMPLVGLFTMNHMAYEIDRDPAVEPSIAEMTSKAIELLQDDPEGFFLMVEGGRIDHAAHGNDPAGHVHDILAYDDAIATALEFARRDGETLVVSVADHETGGMTIGRNLGDRAYYEWRPDVLARVTASTSKMAEIVSEGRDAASVLAEYAHIDTLSMEEQRVLARSEETGRLMGETLGEIISRRALLGWTTYGHTAVDVNTYAFGPGAVNFHGNLDNADVGRILANLLRLDLEAETQRLRAEAGLEQ